MKKRVLSLLLALSLCFGMTAYAFEVDGVDYPTADELNVETEVGNGSVLIFWDAPREIEVPIVDHYVFCRNYETDETIYYYPNFGETIAQFSGLPNSMEYDVSVVYVYETGYEIEAGAFVMPLDGIAPELMAPESVAFFENGVLTVEWIYPGDITDVAYYCIDIVSEDDIKSVDYYVDDPADYKYTFDDLPYDTFTVLICAVDHYGNTSDYAVIEFPESEPVETPAWPFTDVDENHPSFDAINFVYLSGLMAGTGDGTTFSPDMNLSRAMVARILHTTVGNPEAAPSNFDDVKRDFWYTQAIDWASAYRVISGNGKGQFMPNQDVTHEQLAVMLYHFAKAAGMDVTSVEPTDLAATYYDGKTTSTWAKTAVEWACTVGVLTDDGYGNLLPTTPATRAEVAEAVLAFMMYYA